LKLSIRIKSMLSSKRLLRALSSLRVRKRNLLRSKRSVEGTKNEWNMSKKTQWFGIVYLLRWLERWNSFKERGISTELGFM
jgi:hypothetical protein